jgi:hypothetical protein
VVLAVLTGEVSRAARYAQRRKQLTHMVSWRSAFPPSGLPSQPEGIFLPLIALEQRHHQQQGPILMRFHGPRRSRGGVSSPEGASQDGRQTHGEANMKGNICPSAQRHSLSELASHAARFHRLVPPGCPVAPLQGSTIFQAVCATDPVFKGAPVCPHLRRLIAKSHHGRRSPRGRY